MMKAPTPFHLTISEIRNQGTCRRVSNATAAVALLQLKVEAQAFTNTKGPSSITDDAQSYTSTEIDMHSMGSVSPLPPGRPLEARPALPTGQQIEAFQSRIKPLWKPPASSGSITSHEGSTCTSFSAYSWWWPPCTLQHLRTDSPATSSLSPPIQ